MGKQIYMRSLTNRLRRQGQILVIIVALLWILEILDQFIFGRQLDFYGIQPRTFAGLRHIFFAPFLHGGFGHLIANTIPFIVLGWFVMLRRTGDFFRVSIIAGLVSGLGVWLFGAANSTHIGISGVIFGYLGYLLFRGYLERSLQSIFLAILAIFFYGGMLWGIFPTQTGVSWLGHLFGLLGGVLAAYLMTDRRHTIPISLPKISTK